MPELKSIEQLLFGILIEYGIPIALWSRLSGEMEMFFFYGGGGKGFEFLFQYDLLLLIKDTFFDVITVGEFV